MPNNFSVNSAWEQSHPHCVGAAAVKTKIFQLEFMTQFQKCFIARLVVVDGGGDKKIAGRKTFSY